MESQYPKWRYHRVSAPTIVQNAKEDEALGEGWEDTPAAFDEPEPEPEPEHANDNPKHGRKGRK